MEPYNVNVKEKRYTVQQLIHNQSFRRLVKGTADADEVDEWNSWIEKDEEHREKAREAMTAIAGFAFDDPETPDIETEWKQLYRATKGNFESSDQKKYNRNSALTWIYRVAAVLILGSLIGVGFYWYAPTVEEPTHLEQITQERTITTDSGEQKTIKFSNGSRIILNSNSAITYAINQQQGQLINVVVEGEAFFDAEGGDDQQQPIFAVNTPDGVIKDIGTEFLVTVEGNLSRVVLQEGRVEINRQNSKEQASKISVAAGEMLEFTKSKVLERKPVNSTFYTAWATGSMQFDQTTIRQFAGFVEQRFDVDVQIVDPALADITIDGGVYFRSLEELVRSVSKVADIPVYQSRDRETVYIGNQKSNNAN